MMAHVNRIYADGPERVDISGEFDILVQMSYAVSGSTGWVLVLPCIVHDGRSFDDVDGQFAF